MQFDAILMLGDLRLMEAVLSNKNVSVVELHAPKEILEIRPKNNWALNVLLIEEMNNPANSND